MKKIIKALDMKEGQEGILCNAEGCDREYIGHTVKRKGIALLDVDSSIDWYTFFDSSNIDTYSACEVEIEDPIDFSEARVFDPPVLLEVSDYTDFPEEGTHKRLVWAIYPEFDAPIRATGSSVKCSVSSWLYAREIKEDAFEEFYNDKYSETDLNTVKTALKAFWEAGVKHGKENKE